MDEKQIRKKQLEEMAEEIYLPDVSMAGKPEWLKELTLTAVSIESFVMERFPVHEDACDRERLTRIFLEIVAPYLAPRK